jgi:hypothetical protein
VNGIGFKPREWLRSTNKKAKTSTGPQAVEVLSGLSKEDMQHGRKFGGLVLL